MIENLAEHLRLKSIEEVNLYLKSKNEDVTTLFVKAYMAYSGGVLDRYEIQANLDRFRLTEDPPGYVMAYLHRTVQ